MPSFIQRVYCPFRANLDNSVSFIVDGILHISDSLLHETLFYRECDGNCIPRMEIFDLYQVSVPVRSGRPVINRANVTASTKRPVPSPKSHFACERRGGS
jgi:hypothetical protein